MRLEKPSDVKLFIKVLVDNTLRPHVSVSGTTELAEAEGFPERGRVFLRRCGQKLMQDMHL